MTILKCPLVWRPLAMAVLLAAPGACATIHRPPATIASLQLERASIRLEERATTDSIIERLVRRVARRGDRRLDILLLSGGGQHGAYGAGFLRGWQQRTDAPMPQFDLVTGISTGSMQAPFALLGTPDALDTLSTLYRNATERTAPSIDWLFWLRKTGGVVKPGKLEHTIAQVFDRSLAHALQEQFALDRQLVIGTTDMDLGLARTWDFARVLQDSGGVAHARRLLRATSAIPGVFPPVIIDGHVHSDGGVMSNVMPALGFEEYRHLAQRLHAAGEGQPVTIRVWLVMNLFLDPSIVVTSPSSRGRVSSRATWLLFLGQQSQMVERLRVLSRAVSSDVPGLQMEFRFTALDAALANEPGASALFDKGWMNRIEQLG